MYRPILFLIITVLFACCKKDDFLTSSGSSISLSTDMISFDTVFTSVGSITRTVTIYNRNDQKIMLNLIELRGGEGSSFRVNINGNPTPSVRDEVLDAGDSLLLFVQVHIDPNSEKTPFIVRDSIEIVSNGTKNQIQLAAYGQNAHFLNNHQITGTAIWSNELPYVILGKLYVTEQGSLNISQGTRIYCHDKSVLEIDGTLSVEGEGTGDGKVVFRGDRLDAPYKYLPGSWQGIRFGSLGKGNLRWMEIHNAVEGLSLSGVVNPGYQVEVKNSVIDNCKKSAISSNNSSFNIENSLLSNNGQGISISAGSKAIIKQCTIVGYSNQLVQRESPFISIKDHSPNELPAFGVTDVLFENCIIWSDDSYPAGDLFFQKMGSLPYAVKFKSCLIPTEENDPLGEFVQCLFAINPLFRNTSYEAGDYDFRLQQDSPAIDAGNSNGLSPDLDNHSRDIPDLGCYEFLP